MEPVGKDDRAVRLDRGPEDHTATAPERAHWRKVALVLAAIAIVVALAIAVGEPIR